MMSDGASDLMELQGFKSREVIRNIWSGLSS